MTVPVAATDRPAEGLTVTVIGGIGALTLLIHVGHVSAHDLPTLGVLFGVLISMSLSVALIGASAWLYRASLGGYTLCVATWCIVGGVVMVGIASVFTVFQLSVGNPMTDIGYVLMCR